MKTRSHRVRTMLALSGMAMFALTAAQARSADKTAEKNAHNNRSLELAVQLEKAFTDVFDKAKPAVVVITNEQYQQQPQAQQFPPEFYYFFGIPFQSPQAPPQHPRHQERRPFPVGKGSGVIVRSTGYIVTNYHVVDGADALRVKLADGRVFDSARDKTAVKVVGIDKETDLAVLQIGNGKLKGLPTLTFADSRHIHVGQWAIALGAPYNLAYSLTVGHVSQKGRYDVGMTTFENYIQTDASINPGNSGGPLLNIYGQVMGINEFIMTGGGMSHGSIGLGFAIASNLTKQVVDSLIAHGQVIRPFLGITMQRLTDDLKDQFQVKSGVLVNQVLKGDPADKAGVQPGDVILSVGDTPVRTPHDVLFAVLAYHPGDIIKLHINRGGKKMVIGVKATRRGPREEAGIEISDRQDVLNQMGLSLQDTQEGVVVSGVVSGGPADYAQVQRGDRILEVNRIKVKSIDDVVAAFRKTRNNVVVLYIERGGARFFVGIPLGKEGGNGNNGK